MNTRPSPPPAPDRQDLAWHVRRTLLLAGPLIASRVGVLLMTTLDVVVVGRAGATELAYYVLGYAIMDSLIAVMAGLQLGVPILTSKLMGEGRAAAVAIIWRRGLFFAFLAGVAAALVIQGAPWFFSLTGHEPDLARGGGEVTAMLGWALPFFGIFLMSTMFLEAIDKPYLGTLAVLLANVVNLALSVALVFGFGPIPALGAWGCALATVITSALLAAALSAYIRFGLPDREAFGLGREDQEAPSAGEQRQLGWAAGASYGLEAASFSVMTLMAGLLGVLGLASMGVLFQLFALVFMISFGIAGATQVRVGNAWGRADQKGMVFAGLAGFAISLVITAVMSGLFLALPSFFVGLLTTDQAVIAAALPVVIWMTLALLADGGQSVLNHACRGRGDTWVPTVLHLTSYWAIMVPLAWWLALAQGGGTTGLYQAILVSSLFSLVAMGLRFAVLARRPISA